MLNLDTPVFDNTPSGALVVSDENTINSQVFDYVLDIMLEEFLGDYDA